MYSPKLGFGVSKFSQHSLEDVCIVQLKQFFKVAPQGSFFTALRAIVIYYIDIAEILEICYLHIFDYSPDFN